MLHMFQKTKQGWQRNCMKWRLSAMAAAFMKQLEDVAMNELSFEDRFSLLVDAEWSTSC